MFLRKRVQEGSGSGRSLSSLHPKDEEGKDDPHAASLFLSSVQPWVGGGMDRKEQKTAPDEEEKRLESRKEQDDRLPALF